jgi:protein-tyrosine phosphatase
MIFKVLNYFFRITAFSRGKNGQSGLSWFHYTHPSQNFFLIIPEKWELAKEKRNEQENYLVAKNKHKDAQQGFP